MAKVYEDQDQQKLSKDWQKFTKVRALKAKLGEANFEKLAEKIASMRGDFNQRKGKWVLLFLV